MSYRYELRIVTPKGNLGAPLPDAKNVTYIDDDSDVGGITFDYPIGGINADRLEERQEVALLIDGKKLPNGHFFLEEFDGNTVSEEDKPIRKWAGPSLMGRLDEALVVAAFDDHLREDVLTHAEMEEYREKRNEWMQQQIKQAIREAKEQAKDHNDAVRDRRGSTGGNWDGSTAGLNKWGRRAVRWASNQVTNPSQNWYRLCQSFVRQSFGLPGIYATAIDAWRAGTKRPNTPMGSVPAGVPVYWAPNHVALSIGNGNCISTDVLRAGDADVVPIASLSNGVNWSLNYLGWSTEVSGRRIYP